MIKILQQKFVIAAMIAISVLILLLLGTINIVNIVSVGNQIDAKLSIIFKNEGNPNNIPVAPGTTMPEKPFGQKNEYDTFISSNFFVVHFNNNANVVFTDVSRITSVSEENAVDIAKQIYETGLTKGKIGQFRYMAGYSRNGMEKIIVCLDTSSEIYSYLRVLFLSVAIGIVCWIFMLLLVMLLSKKAIKPIAENIEKQKQFVTNAGHEIKTPLAIIQSNTEAMELYTGENKWSKNIKDQTKRLNELMKNLLTLARMDENAAGIMVSNLSISQLLDNYTQSFTELFKMKGITVNTNIQPCVLLHANKEHIEQLISVLIDNAVKYTNENGTVFIGLSGNERKVKLWIENTCDQLPLVEPQKLFDRFYRADEARTQKSGGYGIGLSVAKSIAEAYKASLTVEYKDLNTIIFTAVFNN